MSDTKSKAANLLKRAGIYAGILLIVFLLGFVPMWLNARSYANQYENSQRELKLSQIQNKLASSVINARLGEYEIARQTASDFFTMLRMEIEHHEGSALSNQQRENLKGLLDQRDDIITLLARNDPASADKAMAVYVLYQKGIGQTDVQKPSN